MECVRFGLVGLGNMGSFHAAYMDSLQGGRLSAVCDIDPKKLEEAGKKYDVPRYARYQDLLGSGNVDAVIIATPHYQHPEIALAAFAKNVHVLCEKPLTVSVGEARKVAEAAARHPELKFGMMFQQRTSSAYKKLREVIAEGELGEISRITWLITDWFRTWAYYASGGWRATWAGEGGGVLINQCPHNLDLIQWLTNMTPSRVTAVGFIGKTHPIEVEDEISAILEYPNGAIGHFITSTGEAPGTNRLEICGDQGKIVAEHGRLQFSRARKSIREVREKSKDSFVGVETWQTEIPHSSPIPEGHKAVTQNFIQAILKNEPLIAPGPDGVRQLDLGNAILMSGLTRKPVDLPVNGEAFDRFIQEMTKQYAGRKTLQTAAAAADMGTSFKS